MQDSISENTPEKIVFNLVDRIETRIPVDWKCEESVQVKESEFEPVLHDFFYDGENWIGGEETIKRARDRGILTGLRHAEALLREKTKISLEWRKYCLAFSEVWESPDGRRWIFCIDWNEREDWQLRCGPLVSDILYFARLVACK